MPRYHKFYKALEKFDKWTKLETWQDTWKFPRNRIVHTNPDTSQAFYPWCLDRECWFQCADDHFFEWPKVPTNILFVVSQIENWVHNKLRKQRNEGKKHGYEVFTRYSCRKTWTKDCIWICNMKSGSVVLWLLRWVDDQSWVYIYYDP